MKNPFPKLFCLLLLAANSVLAQFDVNNPFCGSTEIHQQLLEANPQFKTRMLELERKAYIAASNEQSQGRAIYTLPVVVHIIHNNGSENISDAVVDQGIKDLNEGFANMNYYDQGTGLNTDIEFCLATKAPDGSATTGINRVQSILTNTTIAQDLDLKNLSRWNTNDYVNIWLVKEICFGATCSVAGYANFPVRHGLDDDGIVMEARWFGSSKENSTVQIHEAGHYLGLYHTFQGGCKNDACLLDGDRVCDTPPDQSTAAALCGSSVNSCNTDTNSGFTTDQDDMYWNYMDYGDWGCYSAFTQGQVNRMSFFLDDARRSLLDSEGCNDPCPVSTAMSINSAPASIEIGATLTFSVTAPVLNQFEWFVNNISLGTGTTFTYTFNQVGNFVIQVNGGNGNALCTNSDFFNLEVTCPVEASFTTSPTTVFVNESATFTSTSVNASSLEWFIDGTLVNNANSFSQVFTTEGLHEVLLVAKNNACSDTTAITYVFVTKPCENSGTKQLILDDGRAVQFRLLSNGDLIVIIDDGTTVPRKIARLDADQNLIWAKEMNGVGLIVTYDVVEDPIDNGLIFCGRILVNGDRQGLIYKLDANGNFLWAHQTISQDEIIFNEIHQSIDGDFVTAGSFRAPHHDSYMVKIKSDGSTVWSKRYEGIAVSSFKLNQNGNMYISGLPSFNGFDYYGAMAKMDIDGNVLWSKRFLNPAPGDLDEFVYPALENDQADGVVLGFHYQDSTFKAYDAIMSLDQNGDVNWKNEFYYFYQPTSGFVQGRVRYISRTLDGGYVFNSTLSNELLSLIAKVDNQGNMLWTRNFDDKINLFNGHPRMEIFPNGDIIHNHVNNIFITDQNGLLGSCPIDDVDLTVNDFEVDINPFNFHEIGTVSIVSAMVTTSDAAVIFDVLCENVNVSEADAEINTIDAGICNNQYAINWEVCNTGGASIPAGTPYTLYDGDPTSLTASFIFTQSLITALGANQCRTLQAIVTSLPTNEVHIVFNDDGTLIPPFDLELDLPVTAALVECNYFNNIAAISLDNLPTSIPMPFLGNDTMICVGTSLILDPGTFSNYNWDDGSTLDTLIVASPGDYEVTVSDACGNTQADSINIQLLNTPILNLGPDISICENGVTTIDAGNGFESYAWSDGSSEQMLTAWLEGIYSVTVTNICGDTQIDEVIVSFDNTTILNLPDTLTACTGGAVNISVPGNLNYEWSPSSILDCDNCPSVVATPVTDMTLHLLTETIPGCFSSDSIIIVLEDTIRTYEDLSICEGSSIDIFGNPESSAGIYSDNFNSINGCDSVHQITLYVVDTIRTYDNLSICAGSSIDIFGNSESTAGIYSENFNSINGCDSVHQITLYVADTIRTYEDLSICTGSTITIFGNPESTAGIYSENFNSINGCDSVHQITLSTVDTLKTFEDLSICAGSSIDIFGNPESTAGIYSENFNSINGCDSVHQITLSIEAIINGSESIDLCNGDSILVFGNWESMPGNYTELLMTADGCDSLHTIEVVLIDDPGLFSFEQIDLCFGDSVFVFDNWITENAVLSETFPSSFACDSVHQVEINFTDEILLELLPNYTIQNGDSVQLNAEVLSSQINLAFDWSPATHLNCSDCLIPIASPNETTIYNLTATDENNCSISLETMVVVEAGPANSVYLANTFSPNGDLLNDFLFPQGLEGIAKILELRIYDRWGEVVFINENFALNDPSEGWDGTFRGQKMNPGVFISVLEFEWLNGVRETAVGDVLLVR